MRMNLGAILLAVFVACAPGVGQEPSSPPHQELYGVWLHPGDAGHNEAEVAAFMDKARNAHINTIVLLVKNANSLYYASKFFSEDVDPQYRNFDILSATVTEAHKRGMKVHAWLTDFLEGPNGYAFRHHPEWAALNPDGQTTDFETLGTNRPYPFVWMCPARRPGYTDQYLLPMIREIVTNYEVDGIHHDYVRYPGDVNPDGYCFCDYCLEHIFSHSHLAYETPPEEPPSSGACRGSTQTWGATTARNLHTGINGRAARRPIFFSVADMNTTRRRTCPIISIPTAPTPSKHSPAKLMSW